MAIRDESKRNDWTSVRSSARLAASADERMHGTRLVVDALVRSEGDGTGQAERAGVRVGDELALLGGEVAGAMEEAEVARRLRDARQSSGDRSAQPRRRHSPAPAAYQG